MLASIIDPVKIELFLESVQVKSFIPGRIRCYSNLIVNNKKNAGVLENLFQKQAGISEFSINTRTGSILVVYNDCLLTSNPFLMKLEKRLRNGYMKVSQ